MNFKQILLKQKLCYSGTICDWNDSLRSYWYYSAGTEGSSEASGFPSRMYPQEPETAQVQWKLITTLPSISVAQMEERFRVSSFFNGTAKNFVCSITYILT